MMELAILTIRFALGGLTAAAAHWLSQDEEERDEDAVHR